MTVYFKYIKVYGEIMKILLSQNMNIIKKYVKNGSTIGFVPTASEVEADRSYMYKNKTSLTNMGYNIVNIEISIESKEEIISKLNSIDALFAAGGNCFYLLQKIKEKDLLSEIKNFADKKVYIGASAGSCIASPSIEYVHNLDDKELAPKLIDYNSLNFIDSHILPHYGNGFEYDEIIKKTINEYPELKFLTLTDKQAVIVNDFDDYTIVQTE